ncbi:MAG: pyridoxal-phosphate dependent enzyme [Verrucomicrobiota bacterium]
MTKDELFQQILLARQRVYAVGEKTPLHRIPMPEVDAEIWVKREDLGPIKAYKWRGAYNAMASLTESERQRGIVAASAGNHAQGVALAARHLDCKATIFMPRSTPTVKQREVLRHGGDAVTIQLVGDNYDDASEAANAHCESTGGVFIHPYNSPATMGGQGTLADEIVMSGDGPFDRVYVAIGGGGLASAVACWIKWYWPECQVIGVEGVDQASMKAAIDAGKPTELDYVDVFCDGTAVRKVGDLTFGLCRELLDGIVTVTNDEVSGAIRQLWEANRVIPEPSGAMGLAAFQKDYQSGNIPSGEKVLTIVCGANMDFAQLGNIARQAGIGDKQQRYLRIEIGETPGTFEQILRVLRTDVSVIDMQYGKMSSDSAFPVLGLSGTHDDFVILEKSLSDQNIAYDDVTDEDFGNYRIIHYRPELFQNPVFINVEFPERAGALLEFMSRVKDYANLCYFNYAYSGERVGRALVGMEFENLTQQKHCREAIDQMVGENIRAILPVSESMLESLGVSQ